MMGLHQGPTLSQFLFALKVMNELTRHLIGTLSDAWGEDGGRSEAGHTNYI